jgi:hypothetical protein
MLAALGQGTNAAARRSAGDCDHHQRHRPESIIPAAKDGIPASMEDRSADDAG